MDSVAGHMLKRNLVKALDSKMWQDITGLHVATSYLDPSLKGFVFVKDTVKRHNLTEQAGDILKENAISIAKIHVYPEKEF